MRYCLNPKCWKPQNPDSHKFCQNCGTKLIPLLNNHYRLTQVMEDGGLVRTYLARDTDRFNSQCVIKQFTALSKIPPHTEAFAKASKLFEQEAQLLFKLGHHSQIPSFLAYFEQDQHLYLVEEFIDGQNLWRELLERGTFSEQEILDLLTNLLPVIQFIHDRQIIHQDIKPENIIHCRSENKFVLIDFGVAQYLHTEASPESNSRVGTPGYAAIEQMKGENTTFSNDLYSLGATCFHLLSGIHPYDLFIKHRYDWVENWQDYLNNPVDVVLASILNKLLTQEVNQRYQSAREVIKDLQTQPDITRPIIAIKPTNPILPTVPDVTVPKSLVPTQGWRCIHTVTGDSTFKPIAISHDGQIFISKGNDQSIKVWNLYSGELLHTLDQDCQYYFNFCGTTISLDQQTLAYFQGSIITGGNIPGAIKIRNIKTGKIIHSWDCSLPWGYNLQHLHLPFSPDGQILAMAIGNEIALWNLLTGKMSQTLSHASSGSVHYLAFSPDGQILASGGGSAWRSWGTHEVGEPTIKLWQLSDGKLLKTLTGHTDSVLSIAFSSQILASGSADKTIKIWDLNRGILLHTLMQHSQAVQSIAISPDGKILASGGDDMTIHLWDISMGKLLNILTGHSQGISSLAFLSESNTLVSICREQTIKIWQFN